jgi:hypothetical protein
MTRKELIDKLRIVTTALEGKQELIVFAEVCEEIRMMDEMLDTAVYTKLDRDMGEQKLNTWPTPKVLDAMQQERASLRKDVIEFRNKE